MDWHMTLSCAVVLLCCIIRTEYVEGSKESLPNLLNLENFDLSHSTFKTIDDVEEKVEQILAKPHIGSCYMWGKSHIKTFDGKVLSFKSTCPVILARDNVDNTYSVIVQEVPDCEGTKTCYTAVKIFLQDKEYILSRNYEDIPVVTHEGKMLPIPSRLHGFQIDISAHYIVVDVYVLGVQIKWDTERNVEIVVSEDMWNKTSGLCGSFDGDADNDFTPKNGGAFKNVATLVKSWELNGIKEFCLETPTDHNICDQKSLDKKQIAVSFCNNLLNDIQKECTTAIDTNALLDACVWDYCACETNNLQHCTCQTLEILNKVCVKKGLSINWRNEKICPYKCNGGRVYMPCGPIGRQTVCGGLSESLLPMTTCEEGCYCPEGTSFHKNSCIPSEKCPCVNNGKEYTNGNVIHKDCNKCTCNNGKWICTEKICGARCSVIGDPHYVTFDGTRYDFVGTCSYYLLKHVNFTVEAKNSPCYSLVEENALGGSSCVRSLVIKIHDRTIKLKQNQEVTVNNEDIFKFPFDMDNVIIRRASSSFIIVELPNQVYVWWNGKSNTAYIDVPPNMFGETKGLCGTFSQNQRDDFLTPDGDVEHRSVPFANKWKTEEACSDVIDTIHPNPCSVNSHKVPVATEHCQLIKGSIFAECHMAVDPIPFFMDCMYDMCNCENNLAECLCPIISAYATECATKGITINWRNMIQLCNINCTSGQMYQMCGNPCSRSCSDIASTDHCKHECVEGCNCPPGQSFDVDGDCVDISQCGCDYKGVHYQDNYKQIREIKELLSLCTCSNAKWNCRPATENEIDIFPNDLTSTCDKNEHKEFTPCEPVEFRTCRNMHEFTVPTSSPVVCHTGCQCEKEYVFDTNTKRCVKPDECPCHHAGQSYKEDSIVRNDCNTCKCVKSQWRCTDKECQGECTAWGDSHYKTFDGKTFNFQGQCDYILVRGSLPNQYSFDVSIQNVPCSTLGVSCSKSITIRAGTKPNQETITLAKDKEMPDYALLKHTIIKHIGHFVIVEIPEIKLTLHWDKGTRVYVKLGSIWKNKVQGLCGNYNDDQLDDFQTPSGGIPEVSPLIFGDSWRLQHLCPQSFEIVDTCELRPDRKLWATKECGILKTSVFAQCHPEVPVEPYLEHCIFDTCACDQGGDCDCLCTALAAYAHECSVKGINVKWRTPDLCPMQCDERCGHYEACISPCPHETCDNLMVFGKLTSMCKYDNCIEGCDVKPCAEGYVFKNSSLFDCVPKSSCNPVCLKVGNIVYLEGDLMEEDDCHTCHCSRSRKICQGQPCTTLPTTEQIPTESNIEEIKCKPGWTKWINQEQHTSVAKLSEEPLPSSIVINNLEGSHCETNMFVDIQCRTVDTYLTAKETNLDVECSLENGLVCKSRGEVNECPDFEIRVKCSCNEEVTETCVVNQPYQPHDYDCYLYYRCEQTELVVRTCGPSLMFNPLTRKCDFPKKVYAVRPECQVQVTTIAHEECDLDSSSIEDPADCYKYYKCEKSVRGNELVPKTCYPDFMFNTETQQCDFVKNVVGVRPECHEELPEVEFCNLLEPNKPHASDCYLYYRCEQTLKGPELVGKTCGPHLMFNPVKAKCDFPIIVESVRPECAPETIIPEVTSTVTCDIEEPNKPHPHDCHLYYKCSFGNNFEEKSCGSSLMFNPLTLKCDFPDVVIELRPECYLEPEPETCEIGDPNRSEPNDCYTYYRCEIKEDGPQMIRKTCKPEFMFNPNTLKCDFPEKVVQLKPECEIITQPPTEICNINEMDKPHPSDCYIYFRCEEKVLIGKTCGPELMFNPAKQHCDFPINVAKVRPECKTSTILPLTTPVCNIQEPSISSRSDCYKYYNCEKTPLGIDWVLKSCHPQLMFNPETQKCDLPENVLAIKPECEKQPTPICELHQPKQEHPTDCNAYFKCIESSSGNILSEITCGPDMMFNPVKKVCDIEENVVKVRPECRVEIVPTEAHVCELDEPKRENSDNCFLYYVCEITENGMELVERSCGPMLMFNPVSLKCDFPQKVKKIKPECQEELTTLGVIEPTSSPVCDVAEPRIEIRDDCYMYRKCEEKESGPELITKSCYPEFMFNPVTLQCDFKEQVGAVKPMCEEEVPVAETCDLDEPSKPHASDCYLYYRCERKGNHYELVGRTCGPMLMFNSVKLKCDFPKNVIKIRPECLTSTPNPVTEVCEVGEPKRTKEDDCYSYYYCEVTEKQNELILSTCESGLMFNPLTLECGLMSEVVDIKPECQTKPPLIQVCDLNKSTRPNTEDCYNYYRCENFNGTVQEIEKSCKPEFMFNPTTSKCDFPEIVSLIRPECEETMTVSPPTELCLIDQKKKPHVSDCYLYYQCEKTEKGKKEVGKTCGPMLMFNPVKLRCDFPVNVEKLRPECITQTPTPTAEVPSEIPCEINESKRAHPSDCFLYYQCERTNVRNELIERTCGPLLMFNPVSLQCDFPNKVKQFRPECSLSTVMLPTTESQATTPVATSTPIILPACDVAGPAVADPSDCYLYYKCEERDTTVELVQKTCYPEFMFNPTTSNCDFPDIVQLIKPECIQTPPVTETCDVPESTNPHPSDCYLYYRCENTATGKKLVGRTCGPMLMFNPTKLKCDFPANVVKVRQECQSSTSQPLTEICETNEPKTPKPNDCYAYYVCEEGDRVEKTCPSFQMFNPLTLKCDDPSEVFDVKPECETKIPPTEECNISEINRPNPTNCYSYFRCQERNNVPQLVEHSCKPLFMFNRVSSKCDFPVNVPDCREEIVSEICITLDEKKPHISDCYFYYQCEETINGKEMVGKTCGPMLMFNPVKLRCDFPVNVRKVRSECDIQTPKPSTEIPTEPCNLEEPQRPHSSNCSLYYQCEITPEGTELIERTCGHMLVFNPVSLKCDFLEKVVEVKPECIMNTPNPVEKESTSISPTTPLTEFQCDIVGRTIQDENNCYSYYKCEKKGNGINFVQKTCYPEFMFNPVSLQCDFKEQVIVVRPECSEEPEVLETCDVIGSNKPHSSDCYLYYRCESMLNQNNLVGRTCGPMLMFNPVKSKCDFPVNVVKVRPECVEIPLEIIEECQMNEPNRPSPHDCYSYYHCVGGNLVQSTCSSSMMFNPMSLECDDEDKVIAIKPECEFLITEQPPSKECSVADTKVRDPSDCYTFYLCEEKHGTSQLVKKSCKPDFMFNPNILQCDFVENVIMFEPKCQEQVSTLNPPVTCNLLDSKKPHTSDCYLYYQCEKHEKIGKTCGPMLMFNPVKLRCDFPSNVIQVRPECVSQTLKPVTEVPTEVPETICDVNEPKRPHESNCFLYYKCEKNYLVEHTCGPMLMFNPISLQCDFPKKVVQFRPECLSSTIEPYETESPATTKQPLCDIAGPTVADPGNCYLYHKCEEKNGALNLAIKTCYPDFMFNTATGKCDFYEQVSVIRPECVEEKEPIHESCKIADAKKPHSSDCFLYYKCEENVHGKELVGKTCGPMLMFNPIKLQCDFPLNVVSVRPECEPTTELPVINICEIGEPKRPKPDDCYSYYHCKKIEEENHLVEDRCGPFMMFNPLTMQCDDVVNVIQVKPECKIVSTQPPTADECTVSEPNRPSSLDCYSYFACKEINGLARLVEKSCKPDFMFNPSRLSCDFPQEVIAVKPKCIDEVPVTKPPVSVCYENNGKKPHPSDCYLYYQCEETELVGRTCGPMLMFNPVKLKCDFPVQVAKVRPDCGVLIKPETEAPTEEPKPICKINEQKRPHPSDCFLYFICEKTDYENKLVEHTCGPMLMFNPISLNCDFPKRVVQLKPECASNTPLPIEESTPTLKCDIAAPSMENPENCIEYYKCEERENGLELIKKTCHPEFMYNPVTSQCDFYEQVIALKPQCYLEPEITETCNVPGSNSPHPSDCYLYYRCKETLTGNKLVGKTCGPMLMFNPVKLQCDFPANVAKVRQECINHLPEVTEECQVNEPHRPNPDDCYSYYHCVDAHLIQDTCGPSMMFNPLLSQCDDLNNVVKIKPECKIVSTSPPTSDECTVSDQNRPSLRDCYSYFTCTEINGIARLVEKSCKPQFMFNPSTLTCDFPQEVISVKPNCVDEVPPTKPPESVCDKNNDKKPHQSDCYLYYQCEETELVAKTCGPMLMFNPVKLKCDFPVQVEKIRPDCGTLTRPETETPTEKPQPICKIDQPNRPHPTDCFVYYICETTDYGSDLIERTCGPVLMFNPISLKCDFPQKVVQFRPECAPSTFPPISGEETTINPNITTGPIITPKCDITGPSVQDPKNCYEYFKCEERETGLELIKKTCYPEFMFNPVIAKCDFPEQVTVLRPHCKQEPEANEVCEISGLTVPHPSDCYLYYRCEETIKGNQLVGRTCGPMLMFNPVKFKCDFPVNVAKVKPECVEPILEPTEECQIDEPKRPNSDDCYSYYHCVENHLAENNCGPLMMFNPLTLQCDDLNKVIEIKPECELVLTSPPTTDECIVSEPNRPSSRDCYSYLMCTKIDGILRSVEKSCKPDFMFNPSTLRCDFPQEVIAIKPECIDEVPVTKPPVSVCGEYDGRKPHPSDCYLYYHCEETELVGRTCGPMLMFNPVKLKCDFPIQVSKVRPECGVLIKPETEAPTEEPQSICKTDEPKRPHPTDCFLYYTCESTDFGIDLIKRTCGPILMFNPISLNCDFPKKVVQFRPECALSTLPPVSGEETTVTSEAIVTPICDVAGTSLEDPNNCYEYFKCEERETAIELIKKTCYPQFMFNPATAQCDFPEQVIVLKPQCKDQVVQPEVVEVCEVPGLTIPHQSECYLYYRCEETINGNKLVGRTCGPMLMFNPVKLKCDFPADVAKVKPECYKPHPEPTVECEVNEPKRVKSDDCRSYYFCAENNLLEGTCDSSLLFNPKSLICENAEQVIAIKPECAIFVTEQPPSEECLVTHPKLRDSSDCYTFYSCEERNGTPQLVKKSCKPDFMFNPTTLQCDFIQNVIKLEPNCQDQVTVSTSKPLPECNILDSKKPHPYDCYLYYQCERTTNENEEEIGRTCGPMLMFNPVKLRCDFPAKVIQVRPECVTQTTKPTIEIPTEVPKETCDVNEPTRPHPNDCFLYYRCEETGIGNELAERTCGPMLMFNPVSLRCDFPNKVALFRPECTLNPPTTPAIEPPVTPLKPTSLPTCDVAGPVAADPTDCYLYYKCEERDNTVELVQKTCYPEFMFNSFTSKCDFPEQVSVVRSECENEPHVTEMCDVTEPTSPHPSDCHLYYKCEANGNGNELVGRTCGSMLMFNPVKLKCDFQVNVAKVRPECQPSTEIPEEETCKMDEPKRPEPDDCFAYYQCEETNLGNELTKKTCGPTNMFNPVTLECDNPEDVSEIKPECFTHIVEPPIQRECDINEPSRPHLEDCYKYYKCEKLEEGNDYIIKTCKPQFMFNPETSQCDFPDNVIAIVPECVEQVTPKPQMCEILENKTPHPSDCYLYYQCEETVNGNEIVGRTCGPMLMFNSIKLKCDFPVNVFEVRPECQQVSTLIPPSQKCDVDESKRPHPSDCFLYTICEPSENGNALIERTCGPILMFNPITLKCDFPKKVAQLKPECEAKIPTTAETTSKCDVNEHSKPHPTDCYLYYNCEEENFVIKSCYPEFMFNPVSEKCDFPEQVTVLRPECKEVAIITEACDISEPTKPHSSDCYLYYRCEQTGIGSELQGKTCGPMLMFNPVKLKCDFPVNVFKVREECRIQPSTQAPATVTSQECSVADPKQADKVDCYLYYQCEENVMVKLTCGPILMFNPITLKCDFPKNVEKIKPSCALQTPVPPVPTTGLCDVKGTNIPNPTDCYLFLKCEDSEEGPVLITKTCYPEFMFNPISLQCDFPDKVVLLRPECKEVNVVTESCDVGEPNKPHLSDCYVYYRCEMGGKLIGKTCGPDLMFNPIKLKCDFVANVVLARPECVTSTIKPEKECDVTDQKRPDIADCFKYYQCETSKTGNTLVEKTCGPMLMFNPVVLKCDFPNKVVQFRPECEEITVSTPVVTQTCTTDEPNKIDPSNCYGYFTCQEKHNENTYVKKTCYPEFMFSLLTLKCDFIDKVIQHRPECAEITTVPISETCDMAEPNLPHPNDCHLYYQCKEMEGLVGKTCGPHLMFNPVRLLCDQPENVIQIKPQCQETTPAPIPTTPCDISEPKRPSSSDCYTYYQCEIIEGTEKIVERTCGPMLMFNPLNLKCDFPKNVEKVKPECSPSRPITQMCNPDQPKIEIPDDCYHYYECEERKFVSQLIEKTCYPAFMFNPITLQCDFSENVQLVKPTCEGTTEPPIPDVCSIDGAKQPHPSDCYLYYVCNIKEYVAELIGKTCGPDLMFNPVKLQCDFPSKVVDVRNECALTTVLPNVICQVNEPKRAHLDDCYKYYNCEVTDEETKLVERTCGPMLMFNPITLKCDFPKKVILIKPECEVETTTTESPTVTEVCDVTQPNIPDPHDCYSYYTCKQNEEIATLVKKTCYPNFMFNIKTLLCDFPDNVVSLKPGCSEHATTRLPITENCKMHENLPHPIDCFLYYRCEETENGEELVGRTCGPMLMFHPIKLRCDFPTNVAQFRPQCKTELSTTIPSEVCELTDAKQPLEDNCYAYYECEDTDNGKEIAQKTCGPILMFNPIILRCDFPKNVVKIKPECIRSISTTPSSFVTEPVTIETCSMGEPRKPVPTDCYLYKECQEISVIKTCYPHFMFNPATLKCDFPDKVALLRSECEEVEESTESCDIVQSNKPHPSDCYLYYRCEESKNGPKLFGRTCGPMLMFNPIKLKCDFPVNVRKMKPECEEVTETEICDIAEPNKPHPNDCYCSKQVIRQRVCRHYTAQPGCGIKNVL